MNKANNSNDAINELESTQQIEFLSKAEEEREFRELGLRFKGTRANMIRELQDLGYSEFMIGAMVMFSITEDNKQLEKGGLGQWLKRKK